MYDGDQENKGDTPNYSVNFDTAHFDTMPMGMANGDITDLTDDAFYQRLVKLKEEHKKTLEMCEQMYTEKLENQRRTRSRTPSPALQTRSFSTTGNRARSPSPSRSSPLPMQMPRSMDHIRDMSMSEKPPIPRKSSGSPQIRPSSASGHLGRQARTCHRSGSSEENGRWLSQSAYYSDASSTDPVPMHNNSKLTAMTKIENMWDNFSMEKYAPHTKSMRKRSNSLSRLSDASFKSKSLDLDKWKHRITIPKPFSMTVRESTKTPTKSQAMIDLQQKREEEQIKVNEECQKKFKAKPVPAHIYMPLYDEIMEQQEARRRYNQHHSEELTKAMQKPFKLSTREQEKKEKVKRVSQFHKDDNAAKKEFKAKPFPEHLFSDTVYDRMQEEEHYRLIRLKMRSEELLRSSSLPESMAVRGKDYTDGRSRQKIYAERARKAGLTSEHKFMPNINDDMPDFDDQHRRFLRELGQRKGKREATVCKPFNLRTTRIPSKRHKVYEDITRDEELLKENRWPFQLSRAKIRTADNMNYTGEIYCCPFMLFMNVNNFNVFVQGCQKHCLHHWILYRQR